MEKRRELKRKSKELEGCLQEVLDKRIDYLHLQNLKDLSIEITRKIHKQFHLFKLSTSYSSEKEIKIWENFLIDSQQCLNLASIQSARLLFSPKKCFNESKEFIKNLNSNIAKAQKLANLTSEEVKRVSQAARYHKILHKKFTLISQILSTDNEVFKEILQNAKEIAKSRSQPVSVQKENKEESKNEVSESLDLENSEILNKLDSQDLESKL
ncbi:unnamed protein product [Moneuplotes crassus]|uniref:Uncharacterized protein n=1 Tax=Euplotes crassus TaxID=5936 RepID=A0AAD1XU77_EUPCR|nr:unnamed protein product [Moneuplotes crassus]